MRLAACSMFLAAFAAAGCAREQPYAKPLTPVRVRVVQPYASAQAIRYSASVEPRTRVDVAFKASGYIERLATLSGRTIQDGDRVTQGMVLAQVRAADYDEKVTQARAQVAEADAALVQTRAAVERARALLDARSLTRPEMEQAQAAHDTVQARLAGARALLQEAQNARGDTALRSPIDGIVLKRLVEVGTLVAPGVGGFVVADTSSVRVVFGAPDTMLKTLTLGAVEPVSSEAVPGRSYSGRITKIAPAADPRSRAFDVELTVPNEDGALKVGMVAVIQVGDQASTAQRSLAVPLSAVLRAKDHDGYAVFVVEDTAGAPAVHLRPVELGPMMGNEISVTAGLRQGERVVISGTPIVTDGDHVSLIQ